MTSKTGEGAAAAAPSTPAEAEKLLREATVPEQARQIFLFCGDQESGWQAVKLRAQRRYGELLGPATVGGVKGHRYSVRTEHPISPTERSARREARKVAAIPQEQFDGYLQAESKPTHKGLLQKHGVKKPKQQQSKKPKPTLAGKRMRAVRMGRAEAKRNGRRVEFWELGWEVSRMVYGLASWHVEDVPLDYDNRNTMLTVEEDLLYLYDWMDDTLSFIHSRMGEDGMRRQLGKLRAKTVANGCTPEEADAAQRAARRLEQKITKVLAAVS